MDVLGIHADTKPDQAAYIQDDRSFTWREMFETRNRIANSLLKLGLSEGEHSIIYSHNSIEMILAPAGARACGAVSVPMNHRLVAEEVAYVLNDSDAAVVFVDDKFLPIVDEVRPHTSKVRDWVLIGSQTRPWAENLQQLIDAGSPDKDKLRFDGLGGSMIYTSGTTGKPKGARRGITDPSTTLKWIQEFRMDDPNHVHLIAGPLCHSAPAAFAAISQLAGATSVVMRHFDAEQALQLIEKHRCTTTFMAPILLKRIVDLPDAVKSRYDVSSMKVVVVAAAPCPVSLKQKVVDDFGPVLFEFYGSTELGINTIMPPEEILARPESCGRTAPGVELAILDEDGNQLPAGEPGELFVRRNPSMFDGYYKKPEALDKASRGDWVSVGDVAYMDTDGFVYICDRKNDMIISGGINIYPAEIEDVLHGHEKVADAGVFGVPDEEWGERVHAAIQLKPGESVSPEELMVFCRKHLAGYKVPREFSFHQDFPRDDAGKLLKRLLREPYWAERRTRV